MRFRVSRPAMVAALSGINEVASGAGALPVLAHVLTEAGPGLALAATDLEVTARVRLAEAEIIQAGAAALPAKPLYDFARAMEGEFMEITAAPDAAQALIAAGGAQARFGFLPAEEFPRLPAIPESLPVSLPAGVLQRALRRVVPVISNPKLLAGQLQLRADAVLAVATDLNHIGVASETAPGLKGGDSLLLPVRGLRVLAGTAGSMECGPADGGRQVAFRVEGGQELFVQRVEQDKYPDCVGVIPRKAGPGTVACELDRATLAAAVRRLGLMAGGKYIAAKLDWAPGARALTLALANPDAGSAVDVVTATPAPARLAGVDGEPLTASGTIHASVRYLSEALAALDDFERVHLLWEPRYIMVRPVGEQSGSRCLYVISPIFPPKASERAAS